MYNVTQNRPFFHPLSPPCNTTVTQSLTSPSLLRNTGSAPPFTRYVIYGLPF